MPAEHVFVPNMTPLITAEDLLKPGVPERADLVRGVLVVHEPPGFRQGEITVRLTIALGTYVDTRHLGRVVAGDVGFKLQSETPTRYVGLTSRSSVGNDCRSDRVVGAQHAAPLPPYRTG